MNNKGKVATVKIINEVQCAIIGLHPAEYEILWDTYGIMTKGAHFKPAVKARRWDGKIRFFSKGGLTYINLLPEILPELKRMGYTFKLIDKRTAGKLVFPEVQADYFAEFGLELGDHQVEALHAISQYGNGIILAGTGAGKTLITAAICDVIASQNGVKNVVIVPNKDLITQTRIELEEHGVNTGEYSGTEKNLEGDTVVSTWQALQNNPSVLGQFHSLILDECHLVTGKVIQSLLEEHANHISFRIALTGTLHKDECDRMTMRCQLGDVLYTVPAKTLIDKGWLAKLKIIMVTLKETLESEYKVYLAKPGTVKVAFKEFAKAFMPDYDSERAFLSGKEVRNEFIADLVYSLSQRPKGNTFVLVKNVAHGKALSAMIPGSVFVYGKDKSTVRKKIYEAFDKNDNLVVLSTYQLASTGLNIKRIFHLVMVDAGKNFTGVIQTIGRALRKAHDKDAVEVYDLHSNLKFARRHANERKGFYAESEYETVQTVLDYEQKYKQID